MKTETPTLHARLKELDEELELCAAMRDHRERMRDYDDARSWQRRGEIAWQRRSRVAKGEKA